MSKKSGQSSRSKMLAFRRTVLGYHLRHGRHSLPWRKTRDPYAILVSEVMLQQTQVDRVTPYFERWMKKFPTPRALAQAALIDVLREWSGLGYNRRAKYLHDAAKEITAKYGGIVPKDYAALLALPGVGDYTAKAVRVFAHNELEVLIETNVRAVFLHHFFSSGKARQTPRSLSESRRLIHDRELLHIIEKALNGQDARTWYAALMDHGSYLKSKYPNPSCRSKHYTKQSKFEGSVRQVRGAILKAISRGEDIKALRNLYIQHFDIAYISLAREGLLSNNTLTD